MTYGLNAACGCVLSQVLCLSASASEQETMRGAYFFRPCSYGFRNGYCIPSNGSWGICRFIDVIELDTMIKQDLPWCFKTKPNHEAQL